MSDLLKTNCKWCAKTLTKKGGYRPCMIHRFENKTRAYGRVRDGCR